MVRVAAAATSVRHALLGPKQRLCLSKKLSQRKSQLILSSLHSDCCNLVPPRFTALVTHYPKTFDSSHVSRGSPMRSVELTQPSYGSSRTQSYSVYACSCPRLKSIDVNRWWRGQIVAPRSPNSRVSEELRKCLTASHNVVSSHQSHQVIIIKYLNLRNLTECSYMHCGHN